jgi:hypothetical protein
MSIDTLFAERRGGRTSFTERRGGRSLQVLRYAIPDAAKLPSCYKLLLVVEDLFV